MYSVYHPYYVYHSRYCDYRMSQIYRVYQILLRTMAIFLPFAGLDGMDFIGDKLR